MKNVLRGLIYNEQVSITAIDATEIVKEGMRIHSLHNASGELFGKALCFCAFLSAGLKEKRGEISFAVQADCGSMTVSGNYAMQIRGYFDCADSGKNSFGSGTLTVVRDDGYSRPFVGACALTGDDPDVDFAEYFRISEQLPTEIATVIQMDEKGECSFAALIALQPLPFADAKTLAAMPKGDELKGYLERIRLDGLKATFDLFQPTTVTERNAQYKCNCSREYLRGVLTSLGETEMRRIIKEDGAVRVHCHYCNTDYEFVDKDADEMFRKN